MNVSNEVTLLCEGVSVTPYSGSKFEVVLTNPKSQSPNVYIKEDERFKNPLYHIDIYDVIEYYGEEKLLDEIDTDSRTAVNHYGIYNVLENIEVNDVIEHYGESAILEKLGIDDVITNKNKITDGRLLFDDKTFYTRLLSHLTTCKAHCPIGEDELQYLRRVAEKLQSFQIETVDRGSEEYRYLKNLDLV